MHCREGQNRRRGLARWRARLENNVGGTFLHPLSGHTNALNYYYFLKISEDYKTASRKGRGFVSFHLYSICQSDLIANFLGLAMELIDLVLNIARFGRRLIPLSRVCFHL